MGGWWLYSCCFVGYWFQDLFNMTRTILVQSPSSFSLIRLVSVYIVHLYSRIDTTAARKKMRFILTRTVHPFASHMLMSFSVDEILLPSYMNLSTSFRKPPFTVSMSPFWLKHMYSVLSELTWRSMQPAVCSKLCSRDSAWGDVFARSAISSALSESVIICAGYRLLLAFFLYIYIYIYIYIQGSLTKFPDFFRMGTFIDSTHMKL